MTRASLKGQDEHILLLNSMGITLGTIANMLSCHPTAITQRLKSLGVSASDTRRSFMEDIYASLSESHQAWLADQLGPDHTIKAYLRELMLADYQQHKGNEFS